MLGEARLYIMLGRADYPLGAAYDDHENVHYVWENWRDLPITKP